MAATRLFFKYMNEFSRLSRKIRSNFDMDTLADRIKREIGEIREDLEITKENLFFISGHLNGI